jgi:DNA-binding MarR family transcriptional regulator
MQIDYRADLNFAYVLVMNIRNAPRLLDALGESEETSPDELVLALRLATRALLTFLGDQARARDLRLVDLLVLERTAEGAGIVPGDVGAALRLRSSTMTAVSDRLEKKGLLRRVPHPHDRRLVLLRATPRGRKLLDRALGPVTAGLVQHAGRLSPAERKMLVSFAADLSTLLGEQCAMSGSLVDKARR